MCGIAGFSWKQNVITPGRRAILANNLARMNDRRGGDSHGSAVINEETGEITVSRGLGSLADHAYNIADANFFMLHTRFATVGAKTIENSHPFEIGNIIGAHNGCISNHYSLDKKYNRDCKVDSMHLFHHLDEGLPFTDIEGYGAIEWLRKDDPTKIYLSRLKGGSLAIFGIGDENSNKSDGVVWSSDEKHLLESLYCAGISNFFPYKVEEGTIYFVNNGEAYVGTNTKLELASELNRGKHIGWERHEQSYPAYSTRHSSHTGNSTSGGGNNANNKSYQTSSTQRDLTDWQEWSAYCESQESDEEAAGNACGIVTTKTNVVVDEELGVGG